MKKDYFSAYLVQPVCTPTMIRFNLFKLQTNGLCTEFKCMIVKFLKIRPIVLKPLLEIPSKRSTHKRAGRRMQNALTKHMCY